MIEVIDITKKDAIDENVNVEDVALVDEGEEIELKQDFNDVNETYCNTCTHEKDCVNDCQGYEEKTNNVEEELKEAIDNKVDDLYKTFVNLGQTIGKAVEKMGENSANKPEKKTKKFTIGFFGLVGLVVVAKTTVKIVEAINKKK